MKGLAGRMTRYRNRLEGRSGTLWESRYKSSVVERDTYLLACSRYIELNPVRAQMIGRAQDYPRSSYSLRLNETAESIWLGESPGFKGLGLDYSARLARYSELIDQATPPSELQLIRGALQRGQLTGSPRFTEEIENITGMRVSQRSRGRPPPEIVWTLTKKSKGIGFNKSVPFLISFATSFFITINNKLYIKKILKLSFITGACSFTKNYS